MGWTREAAEGEGRQSLQPSCLPLIFTDAIQVFVRSSFGSFCPVWTSDLCGAPALIIMVIVGLVSCYLHSNLMELYDLCLTLSACHSEISILAVDVTLNVPVPTSSSSSSVSIVCLLARYVLPVFIAVSTSSVPFVIISLSLS